MATVLANHASPPIKLRMRGDLVCTRQSYQGVEYWVVKEPLAQKFYQFPPHVYFLLTQLDGRKSAEEILDDYHRRFAPKRIKPEELQQLLQRFHRDSLVVADASHQGFELLKRGRKNWWMETFQKFTNILAVRFRGVDPDRFLGALTYYTGWLFTPLAGLGVGILALVALLSVLINWNEFQANLPGFDQFFNAQKWYLFAIVLAVTKIFHELGHGVSCKKFGGECHEIGFMLLVMTPCLYCNVSDSWRLPSKWQRATIGAAGMYVEVILATIATFVWWFVQPGLVQDICLQVMLVSSVSTVLFNGNPLLRFDGYYILSDLLEIPNLHQRSSRALNTLLGRHWLGLKMPPDPMLPRNRLLAFALFIVASFLYRGFVLFSILVFLTRWLEPYGLETVGQSLAWFSLAGMIGWPGYRLYRFFAVPGRMMQIKPKQFAVVSVISAVVIAIVLFTPWPHSIRCRVVLMPMAMETVYAQEGGVLRELFVKPGEQVLQGQLLARLENLDLDLEIQQVVSDRDQAAKQREIMQRASADISDNFEYIQQLAVLTSELLKHEEVLENLKLRQAELELRAPIAGTVIAAPFAENVPGELDTPLVDRQPILLGQQQGTTLVRGQRLCEVVDQSQWQAVLLLSESQIEWLQMDAATRVMLHAHPGQVWESKITTVGVSDRLLNRQTRMEGPDVMQSRVRVPDLLTELVAKSDQEAIQYFAQAPVTISGIQPRIGEDGQGRIFTGNRSLASRIWRWFNETFGG